MTGRPDLTQSRDLLVAAVGHSIAAARFSCRDLTDEEFFWEPVTPTATHWGAELPLWQLVWTPVVEQFHHGAEIDALRDIRRGHANEDWWPELQGPAWWPL